MIINFAQSWLSYKYCTQKDVYGNSRYVRDIYPVRIDMIISQIYQLVGGFPTTFVSSCISQDILFHMIGNKSLHFIFWEGGVSKTGLYL